jgi:two-component system, sensor histidine kinase and response regulator
MPELKHELYDLTMLFEQVGSDTSSLQRFIAIFTGTVPDDMQNLKEAIDWDDFDKAKAASHKMKSSFLLMGSGWAHQLCMKIEDISKNQSETEKLPVLYEELSENFDKMLLNLSLLTF